MRPVLLLLALLALGPRAAAAARGPVQVAPFDGPAELRALGAEVSRALGAELAPLRPEARPGEGEVAVSGKLEPRGGDGLRLVATCRGQTVEVSGDLEHLDDLVRALSARLRPLLEAPPEGRPEPKPIATGPEPKPVAPKPDKVAPKPDKVVPKPDKVAPKPDKVAPKPDKVATRPDPPGEGPPGPPPREPPMPEPPPRPDLAPAEPPARPEEEPRIAVGIVGEPIGHMPPGLYGIGLAAQGTILHHLQRQRLRASSARIMGLVGGREAMTASLRAGGHFTLMARFESLGASGAGGEYGSLALTGRLHIVLLYDGRLRFDRTYVLPPIAYAQSEPVSAVAARALAPILDTLAADITAKL